MNIAEIRKKARDNKTEERRSISKPIVKILNSPDCLTVEGGPQKTVSAPIISFSPVEKSSIADVQSGKGSLAVGEDRLDQLFSWIPGSEELLLEGSANLFVPEKIIEAISRRWLAFSLGKEDYALDISVIREILKPREITEIPRVPEFLLGIISLRGNIIPIFDLKRRMGLGVATIDQDSRIIVCQDGDRLAGLLIDRITQVTSIAEERIEPPPAIFSGRDRALLDGVGRVEGNTLILLNIQNILTIDSSRL